MDGMSNFTLGIVGFLIIVIFVAVFIPDNRLNDTISCIGIRVDHWIEKTKELEMSDFGDPIEEVYRFDDSQSDIVFTIYENRGYQKLQITRYFPESKKFGKLGRIPYDNIERMIEGLRKAQVWFEENPVD